MHDPGHTVGTLLGENGADTKDVSDQLGHASISITAYIYPGAQAGPPPAQCPRPR